MEHIFLPLCMQWEPGAVRITVLISIERYVKLIKLPRVTRWPDFFVFVRFEPVVCMFVSGC